LLAGSRDAFTALDVELRQLPGAPRWIDERADNRWRNQFAANVALARMAAAVELDPTWNVQLHVQDVQVDSERVSWRGRDVRVLHFSGNAKHRHKALRDAIRAEVRLAEGNQFEEAATPGQARAAPMALSRSMIERLSGKATGLPADLELLRARPWRFAEVPDAVAVVPTMLWYRELQLLHWLARDHFTGAGRIVDGGSFLGGSTAALASGLAARADGPWEAAIASYDLFRVEEYTLAEYAAFLPDPTVGASFRPAFDANIAPWARHVEVREGDACAIGWSGEPIEVLFLDMVKTWQVNDLVLAQFLPCLMPGRSVIVQQDYLWGSCQWIHLTMELLDGSVERLDAMAKGSVVYLLTAPVPSDLIGVRLAEFLEPDRQRQLMDRAVERWQGDERGLVELARAMMIAELDGEPSGLAELDAVLARHVGSARVEQCAAIVSRYLR
jgi:hypothetical protein